MGLLLLCVPLQYFLCNYFGDSENQRTVAIDRLLTGLSRFKKSYFVWDSWQRWCQSIVRGLQTHLGYSHILDSKDPLGECPAIEVIKHRGTKTGFFTESPQIRNERPNEVRYRVGQVVVHKDLGYRGVIVGWDTTAKAPQSWLHKMHQGDQTHWREMPNYSILVDTRDRKIPQKTYEPEENLVLVKNTKVIHPWLDDYFNGFDGSRYIPRPWLKILYPRD